VSGQEEKVLVPALVGLEVSDAHELAFEARVVVVTADPDEPLPLRGTVVAQTPSAGTRVAPAHPVAIAVDTGGGGGGGGGGRRLSTPPPGPRDPSGSKTPA
jgi:beta-lactam-binding protein with PASTA domain